MTETRRSVEPVGSAGNPILPDPHDAPTPAADAERRGLERGHLSLFWDVMYRSLRKMGARAENFYTTVGIFLVIGAAIAVAGTLGFAELGEHVRQGSTLQFDTAVLQWLGAHQTPFLTAFMVEVTPLGTGTVVLMIVGVAAAFLWHTEHKHSARLLLAATAG